MAWSRNPYYSTSEWARLSKRCLARDHHVCYVCGGHATQADHIKLRGEGGPNVLSNLRAICQSCHRTKSAREGSAAALRKRGRTAREPERHPGLR